MDLDALKRTVADSAALRAAAGSAEAKALANTLDTAALERAQNLPPEADISFFNV